MAAGRPQYAPVSVFRRAVVGLGGAAQRDDQPELPPDSCRHHCRLSSASTSTTHRRRGTPHHIGAPGGLGTIRRVRGRARRSARPESRGVQPAVRLQGHARQAGEVALQPAPSGPRLGERPRAGRGGREEGDGRYRSAHERTGPAGRDDDICVPEWWCGAGRDDVGLGWFRLCGGTSCSSSIIHLERAESNYLLSMLFE